MVPSIRDGRWRDLVTGKRSVNFVKLPTRILYTRVALLGRKGDEASVTEAVSLLHDYFVKNESATGDDLKLAFG